MSGALNMLIRPARRPFTLLWTVVGSLALFLAIVAHKEPSFWKPTILTLVVGIASTFWLKSFKLEVGDGVLRYKAPLRPTRIVRLEEITKARMVVEFPRPKNPLLTAFRLELERPSSRGGIVRINSKVFRHEDIQVLVRLFSSRGVLKDGQADEKA